MKYILDTDILVDLLRNSPLITEKIKKENLISNETFISVLTVFELMEGAYLSENESELASTINLISNLQILDLNQKIAQKAGKISSLLKKKGKYIGVGDILIGSTALIENKVLITKNIKHYSEIPNLKLVSW